MGSLLPSPVQFEYGGTGTNSAVAKVLAKRWIETSRPTADTLVGASDDGEDGVVLSLLLLLLLRDFFSCARASTFRGGQAPNQTSFGSSTFLLSLGRGRSMVEESTDESNVILMEAEVVATRNLDLTRRLDRRSECCAGINRILLRKGLRGTRRRVGCANTGSGRI